VARDCLEVGLSGQWRSLNELLMSAYRFSLVARLLTASSCQQPLLNECPLLACENALLNVRVFVVSRRAEPRPTLRQPPPTLQTFS
jgi:hypothetical protein